MMRSCCLALAMVLLSTVMVSGQEKDVSQPPTIDVLLKGAEGTLAQTSAWTLECRRDWRVETPDGSTRDESRYTLIFDRIGGRVRLEVQSAAAESPELICVSDGQQVTILMTAQGLYSRRPLKAPSDVVDADPLLSSALTGTGMQAFLQGDLVRAVHAVASDIEHAGAEQRGGELAHQFRMRWRTAHAQLWLRESDGLPLAFRSEQPAIEGGEQKTVSDVTFDWNLTGEVLEGAFALALPKNARRVVSLFGALAGDDGASLVGQSLPPLNLVGLDGVPVSLGAKSSDQSAVLIFWATWAAPSVSAIPQTSTFVQDYQQRGVAFFAVNVGEEPGVIAQYLDGRKLKSTLVLDRQGQASATLGITRLPAAVIIDRDGVVQEVIHPEPGKLRESLAQGLDRALVAAAASKAQPAESPSTHRRVRRWLWWRR